MNKKIKIILPLIASVLTLASCRGDGGGSKSGGKSSSGQIHHDPDAFNGYYRDYDIDETDPANLQFTLHKLCLDKHTTVVKYAQYSTYNKSTTKPRPVDQSPTDSSKIILYYTGKAVSLSDTSWNREHMWPCANSSGLWVHDKDAGSYYVDGSGYWGGGSDLYNVRPCTKSVNTARGNSKYTEFSGDQTYIEATDGGPYALKVDKASFATRCEPANELKGDIARACMYVYIHYNKYGTYNWYYDEAKTKCVMAALALNNVFGANSIDEAYELISKWNKLDPVDDLEKLRNDTIQEIQGNRNPFVDYPDLIDTCLGL